TCIFPLGPFPLHVETVMWRPLNIGETYKWDFRTGDIVAVIVRNTLRKNPLRWLAGWWRKAPSGCSTATTSGAVGPSKIDLSYSSDRPLKTVLLFPKRANLQGIDR